MNPELEQIAHRIAGALFNGMYQGLALALVLWLGLKLFRGINAATRHAVAFVTLLLVAALPLPHFLSTQKNRDADRAAAAAEDDPGTVARPVQSFQDHGEVNVNAALTPTAFDPAPESPAPRNWIAKEPPGQAMELGL